VRTSVLFGYALLFLALFQSVISVGRPACLAALLPDSAP
jgi:hypothetical protein